MTIPTAAQYWAKFPMTYRAKEMELLAQWIATGESGSVVGLAGIGRATLLGFLCNRPDALQQYLPPYAGQLILISVDLNNLPDHRLATLYRMILRSFYEASARLEPALQEIVEILYRRIEQTNDPFITQGAVRELLLLLQAQEKRVVLVVNRFDLFCLADTSQMTNTLRGLRDSFKSTLSYLMGMRQDVTYFTYLDSIGPLYNILDTHVCRVGPLSEADGRFMIADETRFLKNPLPEKDVTHLLSLTGCYPSLIRVACFWRMSGYQSATHHSVPRRRLDSLLEQQSIQHRLKEIWLGLTQEEQDVLARLQRIYDTQPESNGKARKRVDQQDEIVLEQLMAKGVCRHEDKQWSIVGDLPATYVSRFGAGSRGRVWQDEKTGEIYQGKAAVAELQPLERSLLQFLLQHPQAPHYYSDLIEAAWPDEIAKEGVSTEALFQVIRGIRKRIEPDPGNPRYVINFRGIPEGGYRFFPEGQPG